MQDFERRARKLFGENCISNNRKSIIDFSSFASQFNFKTEKFFLGWHFGMQCGELYFQSNTQTQQFPMSHSFDMGRGWEDVSRPHNLPFQFPLE